LLHCIQAFGYLGGAYLSWANADTHNKSVDQIQ
jgi:hypothetical protein